MITMWCLYDSTPPDWCKTDVHSTNFSLRIQINILRIFKKLLTLLTLMLKIGKERGCVYFNFSSRDPASNCLERLPAEFISTWEDLTTRFLAHFFPPGRTAKLRNDILMFQQHQDESLSEAWNRFKELLQKAPHHVNKIASSCEICSDPHDTQYCMKNLEQAFVDYASLRTDEAGGLVSNIMASQEARISKFKVDLKQQQSKMTNKIDTYLKAFNDRMTRALPSDAVKNPKLNVNYTSSVLSTQPEKDLEDEFKDLNLKLLVLEALAHAPIYNAILDKYVESLELSKNGFVFIQGEMPKKIKDPGLFTLPCRLGDSNPFDTLADLGSL
ncbi:MAK10-like protein [Tanacetum coccineum]